MGGGVGALGTGLRGNLDFGIGAVVGVEGDEGVILRLNQQRRDAGTSQQGLGQPGQVQCRIDICQEQIDVFVFSFSIQPAQNGSGE